MSHQLPKIDINQVNAELCRRSFYFFVQEFWDTIIHEKPIWNWHIEYICNELQTIAERVKNRQPTEYQYYLINVPPGSSKSTIVSQMYIAWTWTIDPTQRFICGSYSQTISRKDAAFTQNILNSDKYRAYFPELKLEKDAVDLVKNNKGGERFATSVGGSVTGQHGHQLILDDPLNPQQSSSEAERRTANDWVSSTLPTRKVNKEIVPTIIVMQRLHENDTCGYLMEKGVNYKHICLPAELDSTVRPLSVVSKYKDGLLDPIRLSIKILEESKKNLGSYAYAGQFGQRPSPAEGGLIKKNWFTICEPTSVPNVPTSFVADTAYTDDEKNDPTGMLAYKVSGNDLYITMFKKGHWEFLDQCKNIIEFAKDNGYSVRSLFEVEPKSSGKDVVSTLKKQTSLNIKEAKNPTKDKTARVNDIVSFIEAGRVYLVRGGWNDDFIEQCAMFPNAKHDEEVDCLVMACNRAFKKKGVIRVG